ncbi:MAG: hypothetical protein GEU75_01890 [Dehalococcoidia bacterium]|nr:hypothetical protein [Dehalococcoidia bacterium]
MTFLKHIFGSRKPDQAIQGSAPQQSTAEQEAIRSRMETEVTRGKEQRAAKAAAESNKDQAD